jgi:hypothetical protein
MEKIVLGPEEVGHLCRMLAWSLAQSHPQGVRIFGVPRGGAIVAQMMLRPEITVVYDPTEADVFIDDIIDSGATKRTYEGLYGKPFYAIVDKLAGEYVGQWIEFFWEAGPETDAEDSVRRILETLGQDVNREGLLDTPKRHVKYLREFLQDEPFNLTTFENDGA